MNNPSILNIVPTNADAAYQRMAASLKGFYKKFSNVRTIFVEYTKDIHGDFFFEDDCLYLRGDDGISPPGPILRKTLDTMLFLENQLSVYDYVIRSNVSTIIDFSTVGKLLANSPGKKHYFTAMVNTVANLDPPLGIVDMKYFGVRYASGTFIGMSVDLVKTIIRKRHYLDFSIVDDVALGIFVRDHTSIDQIWNTPREKFCWIEDENLTLRLAKIKYACQNFHPFAYRNKTSNRFVDCDCIDYTIDCINKRELDSQRKL
jgi:hypothetical protein